MKKYEILAENDDAIVYAKPGSVCGIVANKKIGKAGIACNNVIFHILETTPNFNENGQLSNLEELDNEIARETLTITTKFAVALHENAFQSTKK